MSTATKSITEEGKFSFLTGRMGAFFTKNPQWLAWSFSLVAWSLLAINLFTVSHDLRFSSSRIIYCMPQGTEMVAGHSAYDIQRISSGVLVTILNGLAPWTIMVVAMMFPLLNQPIKHVAFSVRRKDRKTGILGFLIGYTIIWAVAGGFFLLLPFFLDMLTTDKTHLINGLMKSSGFLLAAALIWLPGRPVRLMKCDQTIPIRIGGWQLLFDSLSYGLKMGVACLGMCWAPMAGLMLAHHNIILMYVATILIIHERYMLPHTSKLPGYAWAGIALVVLSTEMWV